MRINGNPVCAGEMSLQAPRSKPEIQALARRSCHRTRPALQMKASLTALQPPHGCGLRVLSPGIADRILTRTRQNHRGSDSTLDTLRPRSASCGRQASDLRQLLRPGNRHLRQAGRGEPVRQPSFDGRPHHLGRKERECEGHAHRAFATAFMQRDLAGAREPARDQLIHPEARLCDSLEQPRSSLRPHRA